MTLTFVSATQNTALIPVTSLLTLCDIAGILFIILKLARLGFCYLQQELSQE